jgi:hypothetical protein
VNYESSPFVFLLRYVNHVAIFHRALANRGKMKISPHFHESHAVQGVRMSEIGFSFEYSNRYSSRKSDYKNVKSFVDDFRLVRPRQGLMGQKDLHCCNSDCARKNANKSLMMFSSTEMR